jgi:uncharacterized protein (TIGR03000 family)
MYRVWTVLASLLVVAGLTISVLAQDKDKDKDKAPDKPVSDKPALDKDQPKKDEPKKDEPKKDEPKKDEPKKDEPKKDEPKKDEPKKDEPKKDEPKKDEPKKDEPKKDEPKKDEPKPAESKPMSFTIKVPAETSIKVGDYQTTTTGTDRTFQTPPALVGKVYTFKIEATYKGKTVKKDLEVSTDKPGSPRLPRRWWARSTPSKLRRPTRARLSRRTSKCPPTSRGRST